MDKKYYYLENRSSSPVGNSLLFWRKNGSGYTCNLDDAELFEENSPELQSLMEHGSATGIKKFRAWEKNYLESCSSRQVDCQEVDNNLALK
jgi:hypothetical protein